MKVDFYPPKGRDTKILAFADVTVADGVVVRGFRVTDGANGVFASVPSKPFTVNGERRFMKQVVFTDNEIRDRFLNELLESYHQWSNSDAVQPREGRTTVPDDGGPPF